MNLFHLSFDFNFAKKWCFCEKITEKSDQFWPKLSIFGKINTNLRRKTGDGQKLVDFRLIRELFPTKITNFEQKYAIFIQGFNARSKMVQFLPEMSSKWRFRGENIHFHIKKCVFFFLKATIFAQKNTVFFSNSRKIRYFEYGKSTKSKINKNPIQV